MKCYCGTSSLDGKTCRVCGEPLPTVEGSSRGDLIANLRLLAYEHEAMRETLTRAQERCGQMLEVCRVAKRIANLMDFSRNLTDTAAPTLEESLALVEELRAEVEKLRAVEGGGE